MTEKDLIDVPVETSLEPINHQEIPAIFRGADEAYVSALEKTAENAPRIIAAMNKILAEVAHDGDWVVQDGKAGLCSAGAERYLKFFPMHFTGWSSEKQEWRDAEGPAYRWVYRCTVEYNGSSTEVEGRFSTRDKFLGYKDKHWRPLEEIDESDIRAAAMHICRGEGIKVMLGLRAIPELALKAMLDLRRAPLQDARRVEYNRGAEGGAPEATEADGKLQKLLWHMCQQLSGADPKVAADILLQASSFKTRDGKEVRGKSDPKQLTGKWLNNTYGNVKKEFVREFGEEEYNAMTQGASNGTSGD